jgi:galactitol-specific phosphotransferase system IIB component
VETQINSITTELAIKYLHELLVNELYLSKIGEATSVFCKTSITQSSKAKNFPLSILNNKLVISKKKLKNANIIFYTSEIAYNEIDSKIQSKYSISVEELF